MHFPGRRALLLSADLRYGRPCHIGDDLTLHAKVAQKVDTQRVVVLTLRIENRTRGTRAATGRVQVRVAEE
jgi:acyl-CoA thioesterase FadM